jgi:hypothetical protein
VYVENAGDFFVPLDAVEAVHSQKVIFNRGKLDRRAAGSDPSCARCRRPQRLSNRLAFLSSGDTFAA